MKKDTLSCTYATYARETEKAVLHEVYGWIPKSQIVEFCDFDGRTYIAIPHWLKNKISRSDYHAGRKVWWVVDKKDVYENLAK